MSTVGQKVQEVRRVLLGTHRPEYNVLTSTITSTTDSLTVTHGATAIARGSYLGIDNEVCYVWSRSNQTVTVQRGMLGTTAAAHTAGALVEVDPRFPNGLILDEMKAEIASWPRAIYQVDSDDLSLGSGDTAVDFGPTGLIDILRIYRQPVSSTDDRWPDLAFSYKRNLPTADFSTGGAIFLDRSGSSSESFDITVVYSKKFTTSTFVDATDLQATVGLSESLEDALKYGTAWRLLAGREVKRTFTEGQGEPRNSDEVPPGHMASVAQQMRQLRNERLADEAKRLAGMHPWRMGR